MLQLSKSNDDAAQSGRIIVNTLNGMMRTFESSLKQDEVNFTAQAQVFVTLALFEIRI